jgi:hypothetical protein
MKKIIASIVLLLITVFAYSQTSDWILIGKSNGYPFYIKSNYVSKETDETGREIIRIWVKAIPTSYVYHHVSYKSARILSLWNIDCSKKQYKVGQTAFYTSSNKLIASIDADILAEFKDVIPDSMAESTVEKVCSLFN